MNRSIIEIRFIDNEIPVVCGVSLAELVKNAINRSGETVSTFLSSKPGVPSKDVLFGIKDNANSFTMLAAVLMTGKHNFDVYYSICRGITISGVMQGKLNTLMLMVQDSNIAEISFAMEFMRRTCKEIVKFKIYSTEEDFDYEFN